MDEGELAVRALARFWIERDGAAAAEMALVLPGVLFLLLGTIYLSMVTYAFTNLNSAVSDAARYASVTTAATGTNTDPGSTAVITYAKSRYKGPTTTPTFTYSTAGACGSSGANGHAVTGTSSFPLFYGFGSKTVALNATACFP